MLGIRKLGGKSGLHFCISVENMFKGCVLYVFASLFCMSKR